MKKAIILLLLVICNFTYAVPIDLENTMDILKGFNGSDKSIYIPALTEYGFTEQKINTWNFTRTNIETYINQLIPALNGRTIPVPNHHIGNIKAVGEAAGELSGSDITNIARFLNDLYNNSLRIVEIAQTENQSTNYDGQTLVQQDTEVQQSKIGVPVDDMRTFTIKYDGNGHTSGSVPVDNNLYTGSMDIGLPSGEGLQKNGYRFVGWGESVLPNGSVSWIPEKNINISKDTILYAQWLPNTPPKTNETTYSVYITPSGRRYHRSNCRTIRGSKTAIDVSVARNRGYSACRVCNP
jgi:hypothetical protein